MRTHLKKTFKSIYDNGVKISVQQIRAKGISKLDIRRTRSIYSEFNNSNVFIDNVKGMQGYLFYWNKKKFVCKHDFIKKYSL